ncbi:MAG TPA: thiolase family protein [Smithellaceae bacterium]|jgi:acetyl-CoA acyltransferase|nr:thiolase family protein [Syntrophaceae bacterium]MBP8609615.1 thiolase family protein [Syntrophaceae bacterium]NMD05680.1 thiolase family protein [Deltaproteobacteria bacterium]HNZ31725.1 thiolase family protein [Smithellaceae bacterium]HQM42647.1 thiolase family protein [Smithellaceae bacterium]
MREAVIVESVRSPGGRYKRGGLSQTRADEFAVQVVKGLMARLPQVKPEDVDDLICGCAFPEAEQGMILGRTIAIGAGLPISVAGMTVNRFCSSGLQSIADATAKIRAGWSDIIIAGGCETMTHIPMGGSAQRPMPEYPWDKPYLWVSMGVTAENVAANYNIAREDLDKFGLESNRRAYEAIKEGKFKEEIIPIEAYKYKVKNGKRIRERVIFDMDDGVRWPAKLEDMAKLKSPFKAGGSCTAGNSSQMTDGAAFSMLMTAEKAQQLGLKPLAKLTYYAVAGCRPEEMGIGPSVAIPKVLKMAGLTTDDIELFEINEAFASQAIYSCRKIGIEDRYWRGDINPNGGAIALGHPLGCTGAKLTAQLLHEMKRRGAKRGIVSMCIGGGMGAAGIYEML